MSNPVERARHAATELLAAYEAAGDVTEREDIARIIACLEPRACRSLAEMAEAALAAARSPGR